jgi:transcriptional regulator with XRE-family HTH domain
MAHSRGSRALERLVRRPTQKQIADRLGVTQQAVSAWLRGAGRPDPDRMAKLEELFGIPMRDWAVEAPSSEGSGEHATFESKATGT